MSQSPDTSDDSLPAQPATGLNGREALPSRPVDKSVFARIPTGTQGVYDLRATLQKRLGILTLLAAAGFAAWFALGLLRWHDEWAADVWSSFTRPPGYGKALPLLCIEGLGAFLLTRRRLGVRWLRRLEWLTFVPVGIFFADKDCMNIRRIPLDELMWNVGTFANDGALGWVILMISYGILIPSTWRRCAGGVGLMALGALIPASVALVVQGMPAVPAVQYLGLKTIALAIAAVIVIVGSRRIQLLQETLQSTLGGSSTQVGVFEQVSLAGTLTMPPTAGRYRLEGEVTSGGMGTIFKGFDVDLGRDVAIKVILDKHLGNPEHVQRFFEEARISAHLQHPGIVPIYDVGHCEHGQPYFAMKLVKGETLGRLLARRQDPSQDLPHFLKVFELLCQTIAYAHSQGVIHRDLKPENVMVGDFGEVMVMDWGIAKILKQSGDIPARIVAGTAAESEILATIPGDALDPDCAPIGDTLPGKVLGTVPFMSPEQAGGDVGLMDERTDVFGLGAILCVILTGQPPYTDSKRKLIYEKARRADLNDAFSRLDGASVDRQLVALAKQCLARDPRDRPKDAAWVLQAVTDYIEGVFKQPERDLVRFFELSLDMFCIAGFDGFFHRVNSNFSRVLGYSDKELLSRPFLDFVHPDDREKSTAELAKLSRGLPVVHFQNRYKDAHGNYRCFDWSAKSIPAEGVIFAVARDVTEEA